MSHPPILRLRPNLVEGVTVVDLLPREMTEPDEAARLGEGLRSLLPANGSIRILINAAATKYMSSTAFAVLMSFGVKMGETGSRVAICEMDEFVRIGADIIKLGRIVPIFEDESTAIASLIV